MHMKNRLTMMTETYKPSGQRRDIYTRLIGEEKPFLTHKNVSRLHKHSSMVMLRDEVTRHE
jgi:hypothetical protein